ncbi:MAG: cysteine--tRNA ligase [Holosporales bacterium]|jgi:cysteinyl-tRNA synthetase|nr:cysteine--tRNA ligase [Holosporales bacterium]
MVSSLFLYNSLSRLKEKFVPLSDQRVTMYVCGPTVYDFAHLGNARAMVAFDILYRVLLHEYKNVTFVRNITDIDDKIYAASLEKKCSFLEISAKFDAEFQRDMCSLNVLEPTYQPHATAFIPQMLEMIGALIQKGFAYEHSGHVLFAVSKFPDYGKLSLKNRDELIAGARVEVAPYKQDACDFVLWKPSSDEMPGWDSPYGRGRPGWHIECSAMSAHYLGKVFDIHAGGVDLIFPHHENEVAQSRCAWGTDRMANFWLHNGHLIVEGKKMSKSLGNFFTVREILQKYHPEAVRLTFLQTHYRQPLDWSSSAIEQAKLLLNKWYRVIEKFEQKADFAELFEGEVEWDDAIAVKAASFFEAMNDDLNTPLALQSFARLVKHLDEVSSGAQRDGELEAVRLELRAVLYCAKVLGLLTVRAVEWFRYSPVNAGDGAGTLDGGVLSNEDVEAKLQERQNARANKDFRKADRIREELERAGIVIEDSERETKWRRL